MITLVHLSDIHFSPRDDLSQFDLDQQIRKALLEDLEQKPADGANYAGVLITGILHMVESKTTTRKRSYFWTNI